MKIEEIRELKDYYVNVLYSQRVAEQVMDDLYYQDRFNVSDIVKPPVHVMRTGRARRLIDGPAEHIITSNPQATRRDLADSEAEVIRNKRILSMVNNLWLPAWKKSNPNVYKQHVKYNLLRGEVWIQVGHNEAWVNDPMDKSGIPVWLRLPDPIIAFGSPNEDENGVPEHLFMVYMRAPAIIKRLYPDWSNPKRRGGNKPDEVMWWEYWDSERRYFEADGETVLKSDENPYGFMPFVHKLSGFGTDSAGNGGGMAQDIMANLIVGRLRFSRDTLRRDCAIVSSIDTAIHTFANRSIDVQGDDQHQVPDDFPDNYILGDGLIREIPTGVRVVRAVEALPEASLFQWYFAVAQQLEREDPLVLAGIPVGESGRQQDATRTDALRRYDAVVENTESAFSTAVGMALRMCDGAVPGLRPPELKRGDINGNYQIDIKLKAEDPLENDRKATLGSRLLSGGEIDPVTNLVDFKGYTQEQAEKIMVQRMKWQVLMSDPNIASLIGLKAAQKAGMEDEIKEMLSQRERDVQRGLVPPQTPTEQRRGMGEVKSQEGFNLIDSALKQRGARQAPERY